MLPSAVLPYVWMLLGAAAFGVMSILTALLKDEVDWQWIAIVRAGLAMSYEAVEQPKDALEAYKKAKSAGSLRPDLASFVDSKLRQLQ